MTDMMMNEMTLTDDILNSVNAGTVTEYGELVAALSHDETLNKWGKIAAHVPIGNCLSAGDIDGIVKALREIDIKADISLGLIGTGLFSSPNSYKRISTGETLTHAEVLEIMKRKFS